MSALGETKNGRIDEIELLKLRQFADERRRRRQAFLQGQQADDGRRGDAAFGADEPNSNAIAGHALRAVRRCAGGYVRWRELRSDAVSLRTSVKLPWGRDEFSIVDPGPSNVKDRDSGIFGGHKSSFSKAVGAHLFGP